MTSRVRRAGAGAAAVCLALGLAGAGCRKSDEAAGGSRGKKAKAPILAPQSNEDLAAPLAKVDDVVITVQELQDNINRQSPYIRARYASKEQKRVFLDNMVRFEVLAREAARRGLDRDPEVVQTMKSAMITKLLKAELASGLKPDDIPEEELRAYFEANRDRFNKEEEVRVSAIVLAKKPQADEVAALARGPEGQSNRGFRELVVRYSVDQESKLRGGDLRYFEKDTKDVPQPVVEAAFQLSRTGEVAGPIEADKKFYIIKQTGRRGAVSKTYDKVKREIQNELYKGKREGSQRQLVDRLRSKSKIEVYEDNLAKVRVDTSSRAVGFEPPEPGEASPAGGKP
jgi:peptidyl-prolyl cis-trans isomerase C